MGVKVGGETMLLGVSCCLETCYNGLSWIETRFESVMEALRLVPGVCWQWGNFSVVWRKHHAIQMTAGRREHDIYFPVLSGWRAEDTSCILKHHLVGCVQVWLQLSPWPCVDGTRYLRGSQAFGKVSRQSIWQMCNKRETRTLTLLPGVDEE